MSNFNEFQRAAKAAIRVALQWFFLAIPTGWSAWAGGHFVPPFRRARHRAAGRPAVAAVPAAGGGLLITALYKATKCEGVGTNNVIRAVQSGEPVSILLVPAIFPRHRAHPSVRRLCRARRRCSAAGRQHRLEPWHPAAAQGPRPPHRHHQRHGCVLSRPCSAPPHRCPLRHDGGGRGPDLYLGLCPGLHLGPHRLRLLAGLWHRPHPLLPSRPRADGLDRLPRHPAGVRVRRRLPACSAGLLHFMEHTVPKLLPRTARGCGSLRAACCRRRLFPICSAWGGTTVRAWASSPMPWSGARPCRGIFCARFFSPR